MEFPPIEKSNTHISYRRSTDTTSSDSSVHSSASSIHGYDHFGIPTNALTPTVTRQTQLSRTFTRLTTCGTTFTSDPSFEVEFDDDDPKNPRNWSTAYKGMILFFLAFSSMVVVLYSTSYTSAIGTMMEEFHIKSRTVATLGLTSYLIGLAVGSVLLAPLSETYGRKPVYVGALFVFTIFVIPAAVAKDITTLIVVRFFGAVAGSAMIANAPGTIGDVFSDDFRATGFSLFSLGPMMSPVFGPIFGGFVTQYLSWRWANWIVLILGAVSFGMMVIMEETYSPIILQKRAKALRKSSGENRYWSRYDIKVGFLELMRVNLSRPFVMAVTEPICIFWNVYVGIVYAILYLCFASYPIVFREGRGWSLGLSSLSFCGIGVGILTTICLASPIKKMINSHKPDADGHIAPESMMSVVCIAAVLVPVGELWFAWTCLPASIHPAVSIAAGIPFGAGNAAIFIYVSNYLAGSYGIYAASALAGNSVVRSVLGGVIPLAGPPLYKAIGANWAGTLLGLLEVLIIPVPFIFYRYGHKIREKSSLIREMREIEEKQILKKKRATERMNRQLQVQFQEPAVSTSEPKADRTSSDTASENTAVNHSTMNLQVLDLDVEKQAQAELTRVSGLSS